MFSYFDYLSEIEAKVCFRFNPKTQLVSNVNIHEFQGIKHDLLQEFHNVFDYYQTITFYKNGIRKIETENCDDKGTLSNVYFEKKTRVNQFIHSTNISFLFIKWTHSREEKVDEIGDDIYLIRRKNVCKIKYNNNWDIYLTMVNGYNCEIEIEWSNNVIYPPTLEQINEIDKLIVNLFKNRYEPKIIKQFNLLVCRKSIPHLNWCVNKPVNLKFNMWKKITNDTYGFYLKMDGIRYLLYSIGGKLYAINETSRIIVFENTRIPYNTILDAEYLNDTFHIFDVLFFNGNDLRDKGMYFRNIILKNMQYDLNMEFTEINTDYNLIWHYIICGLPEHTDGIVFFPLDESYKNKCTYKYKPVELLTIDFLIKPNGLYVVDIDGNNILFRGNTLYPYTFTFNNELKIDSITEFQFKNGQFIPIRIRHDKIKPNYIDVALDIWEDINNPIDLSSFIQNILSCQ